MCHFGPHSQSEKVNAVTYIPSAKAVFQGDHYNAQFKSRGSYVSRAGMAFKSEIERLGLDVNYLYSAHTRKAEPWVLFETMAGKHIPGPCQTLDSCIRQMSYFREI